MTVGPLGLPIRPCAVIPARAPVPVDAEPPQVIDELRDLGLIRPFPVGILDTPDETPIPCAGVQPRIEGGSKIPEVQGPCRARGKTRSNRIDHGGEYNAPSTCTRGSPMSRTLIRPLIAVLALLTASFALAGKPADTKPADKAAAAAAAEKPVEPPPSRVRVDTNLGSFTIQLELSRAPLTVSNFVYMRDGHYNGLVFHRVVSNFIVQAGGYDKNLSQRSAIRSVANESGNGLSNKRGTVGLARTDAPHSGNAQFYVNLTDNEELDPTPLRWGYAVFGRVIDGFDVVEKIGKVPTGSGGPFGKDVPLDPVIIESVTPIQ